MATSQPLGFTLQDITTATTAFILAFYTSWNLTLVTLAAVPITAVVLSIISARMQPSIAAQHTGLTKASKLANNAIVSIDTAKFFNGQSFEVHRYTYAIRDAAQHYLRQARSNALQIGFVRLTALGMFVQGFWYGSFLVRAGKSSPGEVLTTFWACLMATQSIEQILPQMMVLEKGRAAGVALRSILEQLSRRRRKMGPVGARAPMFCDGDIDVRNVSWKLEANGSCARF
jgi:ATP-binding cassette subfamily B (MDR/TAP) protein 1